MISVDSASCSHETYLLYRRRSVLNMGAAAQEDVAFGDEFHCGASPSAEAVRDALEWSGQPGWTIEARQLRKGPWTLAWITVDRQWPLFTLSCGALRYSGAYLGEMMRIAQRDLKEMSDALQ